MRQVLASTIVLMGILSLAQAGASGRGPSPVWPAEENADPATLSELEKRMLAIEIPEINFRQVSMVDVVDFLDQRVKESRSEIERDDTTRVRVKLDGPSDVKTVSDAAPLITLGFRKIPLLHAIRLVCQVADFEYRIEGNEVLMKSARKQPTMKFTVPAGARERAPAVP